MRVERRWGEEMRRVRMGDGRGELVRGGGGVGERNGGRCGGKRHRWGERSWMGKGRVSHSGWEGEKGKGKRSREREGDGVVMWR